MAIRCATCGLERHDLSCGEMFFRGRDGLPDRSRPRGVPGAMPAQPAEAVEAPVAPRKRHESTTSTDELDRIRPGFDPAEEDRRLAARNRRAAVLRDLWWLIVKDGREMERTGHGAAVRWARAGLGFEDRI